MSQSVKKMYYKLSQNEFNDYLNSLKNNPSTIYMLDYYFYTPTIELIELAHQLDLKQQELDFIVSICSPFQVNKLKEGCMISEIQSTNLTENIYSTHSDIFGLMKNVKNIKNKKIKSAIQAYMNIEESNDKDITDLKDIRKIYEHMMEDAYESREDHIDGTYFRKGNVNITNGIKIIHQGLKSEEKINEAMEQFIELYHANMNPYIRIIITHFLIETIHPYYDGNGRLGRLLMSMNLYNNTSSLFSYSIATAINLQKNKYYKALEIARDVHEFGCINAYVEMMLKILLDGFTQLINDTKEKISIYNQCRSTPPSLSLTKSEKKVYDLLVEAYIFSYFGISNEEIMSITKISKRTLLSTMKKFRELDLLIDLQLGIVTYHKIAPQIQ